MLHVADINIFENAGDMREFVESQKIGSYDIEVHERQD
jgi:hypothetical protein